MKYNNKKEWIGIFFLIPSLVGTSIFVLLPYMYIILRSFGFFQKNNQITLENYRRVITNEAFRLAVKNTIFFTVISISFLLIISLAVAYLITENIKQTGWIKMGVLLPMSIPISTVIILWNTVFHKYGLLNKFLLYPIGEGIDWLNSVYAMIILVFSFIWRNVGFAIALWIVGILSIPSEVIQASKIDGANIMQRFRYIICPNLVYYFLCITILATINSFKIYREAYLIAGEYPHESIYMMQHLFNNWFRDLKILDLSAAAVIQLTVTVVVLFILQNIYAKRGLEL